MNVTTCAIEARGEGPTVEADNLSDLLKPEGFQAGRSWSRWLRSKNKTGLGNYDRTNNRSGPVHAVSD